jgi:hypothetical protein
MFRLTLVSLLISALAACGDSSASGSGVSGNKKLTQLTATEREDLCNYNFEVGGGVQVETCQGDSVRTQTVAQCAASLAQVSDSCTATVSNAEACAEATGNGLCEALLSPKCMFLFTCGGREPSTPDPLGR